MVMCKYYNQLKDEVLWPRLKVGSSTVMFIVRIQIALPENIRKGFYLLEVAVFCFAYLPRIEPVYLRNGAIFVFKRTTPNYVSSNSWQVGKKNSSSCPSSGLQTEPFKHLFR